MTLAKKRCVPCEGGLPKMIAAEATLRLIEVPGWELRDNAEWIRRRITFRNFREALDFVNRVGEIAEREGHHPDITFGWGYCDLRLQTHAIGGLHENDFVLAAKINEALDEMKA